MKKVAVGLGVGVMCLVLAAVMWSGAKNSAQMEVRKFGNGLNSIRVDLGSAQKKARSLSWEAYIVLSWYDEVGPGTEILVEYEITYNGDISNFIFQSNLDTDRLDLVEGSVLTSKGNSLDVVYQGQVYGDKQVGVFVENLEAYRTLDISYDVVLRSPYPDEQFVQDVTADVVALAAATFSVDGEVDGEICSPSAAGCGDSIQECCAYFGFTLESENTVCCLKTYMEPLATVTVAAPIGMDYARPGDEVYFEIVVTVTGDQEIDDLHYAATVSTGAHLIPGSVTTTSGRVTDGNRKNDNTMGVSFGTPASPGDRFIVQYGIRIDDPYPCSAGSSVTSPGVLTSNDIVVYPDDRYASVKGVIPAIPVRAAPALVVTKAYDIEPDCAPFTTCLNCKEEAAPGDTIRWTIEVTNVGDANACDGVAKDVIDADTTLADCDGASQCSWASGECGYDAWCAADLSYFTLPLPEIPGRSGKYAYAFEVVVNDPVTGTTNAITNSAEVTGSNFASVAAQLVSPSGVGVDAAPGALFVKGYALTGDVGLDSVVNPGDTVTFSMTLQSTGSEDLADVRINDPVPAHGAVVPGSIVVLSSDPDVAASAVIARGNEEGATNVVVKVPNVRFDVTVEYDFLLDSSFPNGVDSVTNQAYATGSNFNRIATTAAGSPVQGTPTVVPVGSNPVFEGVKTSRIVSGADDNGDIVPGTIVEYDLLVTNVGDQEAVGVVLTDEFEDDAVELITGSVTCCYQDVEDCNVDPVLLDCRVTAGNFYSDSFDTPVRVEMDEVPAAGGYLHVTFQVRVKDPFPAQSSLTVPNVATVSASNLDSDYTFSADTDIIVVAEVILIDPPSGKICGTCRNARGELHPEACSPGDFMDCTLTVANTGNRDGLNVVVRDVPEPDVLFVVRQNFGTSRGFVEVAEDGSELTLTVEDFPARTYLEVYFTLRISNSLNTSNPAVASQNVQNCVTFTLDNGDDGPPCFLEADARSPRQGGQLSIVLDIPEVQITQSAALAIDFSGDGEVNTRDFLDYAIVYTISTINGLREVRLLSLLDDNTALTVGSVEGRVGNVINGNNANDRSILVETRNLPGGFITFFLKFRGQVTGEAEVPTNIENYGFLSLSGVAESLELPSLNPEVVFVTLESPASHLSMSLATLAIAFLFNVFAF
eukprot:CAMPEP_0119132190 /NCGR_PEP_ID=MMETSP1310-20130426/11703_1 /TAXON_ID=464262 /ORGANISM="Genus nov. species nov., Strain RCC2339" /LENGTH=1156 /DNA_ID=CAMNT_0007122809 /DNA_START=106 /DNA_END=3576 /DNA_ORIENTATION=-